MHTIKLLLTYYLNISVQAANLSDCRIESNRLFFLPELECSSGDHATRQRICSLYRREGLEAADASRFLRYLLVLLTHPPNVLL